MNLTNMLYHLNSKYPGNYSVLPDASDEYLLIAVNPSLRKDWGRIVLPFTFMGRDVVIFSVGIDND